MQQESQSLDPSFFSLIPVIIFDERLITKKQLFSLSWPSSLYLFNIMYSPLNPCDFSSVSVVRKIVRRGESSLQLIYSCGQKKTRSLMSCNQVNEWGRSERLKWEARKRKREREREEKPSGLIRPTKSVTREESKDLMDFTTCLSCPVFFSHTRRRGRDSLSLQSRSQVKLVNKS